MYIVSQKKQIQDEESRALFREPNYKWYITSRLKELANVAAAHGQLTHAAQLWRLAASICDSVALPATPDVKSLSRNPTGLTEREMGVLRLVAQGLTNPQIAEELIISLHTVNAHVRSIYNKLDVNSRAAATRFATEHWLV